MSSAYLGVGFSAFTDIAQFFTPRLREEATYLIECNSE
jgi:hypothetical protein